MAVMLACLAGCTSEGSMAGPKPAVGRPSLHSLPPPSPHGVTTPAAPPKRPSATRLPACRADDLSGRLAHRNGLTGGTIIDYFVLTNVGTRDCFLAGTPSVSAFDRSGRPVHLVTATLDGDFAHPKGRIALLARSSRPAWREAQVPMSVSDLTSGMNPCPRGRYVQFGQVEVALPNSGSVTTQVRRHSDGGPLGTCEGRIRTGSFFAPAT